MVLQIEEFSSQNEDLMRQLKASLAKEAKFTTIIQNLTNTTGSNSNNSSNPSPNKDKPPRRHRSKTDSSVPNHKSMVKLPKVQHRHNHNRAFHCFD